MAERWPTAAEMMTARPLSVSPDAPLSQALGVMRTRRIHEVPVVRQRRVLGMVTFDAIARRTNVPLATKVSHLMLLPPIVTPTTPFAEVVEALLAAGLRAAPVTGAKNELLGVVSRTDLVAALPDLGAVAAHRLSEVMEPLTLVLSEGDPCGNLLGQDQLRQIENHPLPVVDRKGRITGAVGVADLGELLWRPQSPGHRDAGGKDSVYGVQIRSIMHTPPLTATASTTAGAAAQLMTRQRVSSVFVVDGSRPVGVVSQADLLGLAVGGGPGPRERGALGDVFVQVQGLRGSSDPAVLADIDRVVARGLRRIARQVHPVMLNLRVSPHASHRSGEATVEGRLYTDRAIYYASRTGWNLYAALTDLLDEVERQTRRVKEERGRRGHGRRDRGSFPPVEESPGDADLERQIRSATRPDED